MRDPDAVRRCDVVVIGAGVIGAAAAWELARCGATVVLLERFDPLHARGSSHGATRIFRLSHGDVRMVESAVASLPGWRALQEETGIEVLQTTGGIDHGDAAELAAITRALDATALPYQVIAPQAASGRWPGMRFTGPVVFQPDAGRILAEHALVAFTAGAAANGAEVQFSRPVHAVEVGSDGKATVVVTDAEDYQADVVVVATGAWAGRVLGSGSAVPFPAISVREVPVFHFAPKVDATWPSFIHHGEPSVYGLLTPGIGVKVGEYGIGRVVDPDSRDGSLPSSDRLTSYVERWLPGLHPAPVSEAPCLYATGPRDEFVIERHGAVVVAAGFSGHGFKHAPAVARRIADLALYGR